MKVCFSKSDLPKHFSSAVAIGFFDGVHKGHKKLIAALVEEARRRKLKSIVVTFEPHPYIVLHGAKKKPIITPLERKLSIIGSLVPDFCYVIRFSKKLSQMTPEDFVKEYISRTFCAHLVMVGFNFRFGHDRKGSGETLKKLGEKYGYKTRIFRSVSSGSSIVSSSLIRDSIKAGDLFAARRMLGREVEITGTVVRGDGKGHDFGFPTANLRLAGEIMPPQGVYFIKAFVQGKSYPGVLNIGLRPGFVKKISAGKLKIEINLFGFKQDIYGRKVIVRILKKHREEIRFSSPEELIRKVLGDIRQAKRFFVKRKP